MAAVLSLHVDTFMVVTKELSHVWDIHGTWSMERKVRQIEMARNLKLQWKGVTYVVSAPLSVVSKSGAWAWFRRPNSTSNFVLCCILLTEYDMSI